MGKSLKERVKDGFEGAEIKEYSCEYLKIIRENTIKAEENMGRATIFLFATMVLFEFLIRGAISEVSIGSFKLNDLTSISLVIPALFSYLYFDLVVIIARSDRLSAIHRFIIRKLYPSIDDNDLTEYLLFTPSLYEDKFFFTGKIGSIQYSLWVIQLLFLTLFVPVFFLIYSFYRLFSITGLSNSLVWLSLIVSAIFFIQGFLISIALFMETRYDRD